MFEPHWGISARELRARVREALDPRHVEGKMIGIHVKDHQFSTVNEKTGLNRTSPRETGPGRTHPDLQYRFQLRQTEN